MKRGFARLSAAVCAWGCYKQYRGGKWVCATCGN
jgi:hypothetical protein